jgi:hypothetical protein
MNPTVKFNPRLMWDYSITKKDLQNEDVLILYISRVLDNGTLVDVKGVPLELVDKYLDRLYLSRSVRTFWEWYLKRVPVKPKAGEL